MEAAFENALRTVADSYESEINRHGGRSLARVATIVINNGAFFNRLRSGKPFYVSNLERFASWFRDPHNWPHGIPRDAIAALTSMGRAPDGVSIQHLLGVGSDVVASDRTSFSDGRRA